MRLKIIMNSDKSIPLPKYYQHILQAVIYELIGDPTVKEFLHNQGFLWEKRSFKPLSFSWLQGRYEVNRTQIVFHSPVALYLSSPWERLIRLLLENLFKRDGIQLGKTQVSISDVEMLPDPVFEKQTFIRTLSPITMYSTLTAPDGRKVTHYYDARDPQFSELLRRNLVKKALAFHNLNLSDAPFSIWPVGGEKDGLRQHTIRYKSLIIKGWMGVFGMEGDARLQKIAYDMGLGGKNSIGMGFITVND